MKKSKKAVKYILILIFIIITTLSTLNAVNSIKPLRLAVWNNSTTAIVLPNGEISGFEPSLFKALSTYISRPTEIKVYPDKNSSLEALKNNEVDVVMSSLYTSEIDEDFDFTNIMVRQVDALLCSFEKDYTYQEYSSMKGKTIGYLDRGATMKPILDYLKNKIENPNLIPFDTVQQIRDALENNEIELATFGIGALKPNYDILDRFYALPTYYITREGESGLINDALSSFLYNSHELYNSLYYKFYPRSITTEFTKEEIEYIKSNPKIKVATFIDKNVFSSMNTSGQIVGIFPDIIREINNITGLDMTLVQSGNESTLSQMIQNGTCDVAIGLDCLKSLSYEHNVSFCDSVMRIPMELIIRRSTLLDKNSAQTVVIANKNCDTQDFITENYPNWKIVFEKDLTKRYQMLVDGDVDYLIDSSFSFNYLSVKPEYANLTRYPVSIYYSNLNILINSEIEEPLLDIMNKAIIQIKNKNIGTIVDNNIAKIVYTPTLFDFFISHRIEYLGILLLIFFFFFVIYIIASNRRRTELEIANNELVHAEKEAIIANQAKSVFLARMSHDMRTPLGAVIGLADFGENEAKDEKIRLYFKEITNSASYLLSLMDDILDSQKLQSDNFEFEYGLIHLCDTFKRVKTVVENRANKKGLNLEIKSDCDSFERCIYADEKRISQILVNILNNAIKYTPEGGTISWISSFTQINDEKVIYHAKISDTGVGMSEDFVKYHLFKPFSKENNSLSKSEGGSGLGLNICKKLIDQMNGTITCESVIDVGTTFNISITFKIASEEETKEYLEAKNNKTQNKVHKSFKGSKVLVCDDTEINIKIVKKILEKKGIIVDTALNGQEAIDKVGLENFDAVLMDIRMPIVDGLEATKQIRSFNKDIPIIAISANAYTEDVEESLRVGMNAHLAKPIDVDLLFETLEDILLSK